MTQEDLREHQKTTNMNPVKKSYNIDDVIKRVDELEEENKALLNIIDMLTERVDRLEAGYE